MDFEELMEFVAKQKARGLTDEDILNIFFKAFTEQEMDLEDLEKVTKALGYEFSDEFIKELKKEGMK